jgi:hypothetical protein
MDVIGFLYVSLGSSTAQVADAHAHVQRLVSVVKMATMVEECTTAEQRSVVLVFRQKDLVQRIFIKKCLRWEVFVA